MKYALGNMLNGAGGLNADQLALDLQFAADKTLTARKGPTPVFTRASSGTFVGSNGLIQSAGNNVARFDHNPVTLASRGLLIEESRTNLLLRSELLSNTTSWSNYQITGSATSAPDGNNTATLFTETTVNDAHVNQGAFGNNRPTPGAVACTFSIFLKAGTRRYVMVSASAGGNGVGMMVDTQSWTVTEAKSLGTGWTYTSNRLADYGNGWYRAELTFTPPAATAVICGFAGSTLSTFSNFAPSYLGNSSTFIAWGAQLEVGSFATSYIPTTTASVVRSADVCSITGADFTSIWNGVDATVLFIGSRIAIAPTQTNWALNSGSTATSISSDRTTSFERINAAATGIINSTPLPALSTYKIAVALKSSDYAASFNGASVLTSSSSFELSLNRLNIGGNFSGTPINGWINSMKLFKKRLANQKLQALTV